jgi:hypothetical protein
MGARELDLCSRGIKAPNKWGRSFGPSWSVDGRDLPALADLTPDHLDFWASRSTLRAHPRSARSLPA